MIWCWFMVVWIVMLVVSSLLFVILVSLVVIGWMLWFVLL